MSRQWIIGLCIAALATTVGCGGSSGNGDGGGSGPTASLTGRVAADPVAARVATRTLDTPVDVVAVDETGTKADEALDVIDSFTLVVPTGHEYVLIFSDSDGIIGAMVYGEPGQERADFSVDQGTISLDLGEIVVNPSQRSVHATGSERFQRPENDPGDDFDRDGIPDDLDDDDDNDGIRDDSDDYPYDHDNDGITDDDDLDDDGDGILDEDDDHPADVDDDGQDDDRDQCDKRADDGAQLWVSNGCGACHGADGSGGMEPIRGADVNDIVHALKRGEGHPGDDDYMPAYPELVRYGPDFRAFLGCNADSDDAICFGADAANGAEVFETYCAGCHTAAQIGDEDEEEIIEVLQLGEDEMMPMPGFIEDAADIAAYLSGCPVTTIDTDQDGVADAADQCPGTAAGATVDEFGCEVTTPTRPQAMDTACVTCHGNTNENTICANGGFHPTWLQHGDGGGSPEVDAGLFSEVSAWAGCQ